MRTVRQGVLFLLVSVPLVACAHDRDRVVFLPPVTAPHTSGSDAASGVPAACITAQLTISSQAVEGGLDHGGTVLVFENLGRPCLLAGYPGVETEDSAGKIVGMVTRSPRGYLGGLNEGASTPYLELDRGEAASALTEGRTAGTPGGSPCPSYVALRVIPPKEAQSVRLPSEQSLCYLEIHPFIPGRTGGANSP
ncbi:MAG: DUF4232 domain-containing protein [Acidimicrobiales bacterium]